MTRSSFDLVIRASRAITEEGEIACTVGVSDGKITAIQPFDQDLDGRAAMKLGADDVLMPGIVDTHAHINEPGRTDWEGFAYATQAAAGGGVTTVLDMPLNSDPPVLDAEALVAKRSAAAAQCRVDVGFWGGAVPTNVDRLHRLHEEGVFGFKGFLAPSGIDEFPYLSAADLEAAMTELRSFDGLMLVHAEDGDVLRRAPQTPGPRYADYLRSRPREAEDAAIATVIDAVRKTGARTHIVHLSSSDALEQIRVARREGLQLTVETCPHYLTLAAEGIADGATQFKCAPPIRESSNQDALWGGLQEGLIDCIVSDHSPCPPSMKNQDTGDFATAWGGISSLQMGLPVTWTAARKRGFTLGDVARWMAAGPARVAGLTSKGRIAIGCDADFTIFAPDASFVVGHDSLLSRHHLSPYEGQRLWGMVRSTWLRGQFVDKNAARGRMLVRGKA